MKNKGRWMLAGFLLVVFGLTSLILQMVGAQWAFLRFLEIPGRLFAFVAEIIMVMAGFIIFILAKTDWNQEREESGEV
jgi:Na+(H+)/acetate symporter ActP